MLALIQTGLKDSQTSGGNVVSVQLTNTRLDMPGLGEGELILDSGGSRLPTDEESRLLGLGPRHLPRPATALPYRYQDDYLRETEPRVQRVAILDNGRIRATFLLDLGGRLWKLQDLETGRETLHQPDVLQLANLAIRNAWFAGGVEWNLGITGHWGLTCEPVNAAIIGGSHMRMWAFERITNLVWQLDVHLPRDSSSLFVHTTLANERPYAVPVYWWSNIAVPQTADTRVLADAERAYHFGYAFQLNEVDYPVRDGVDVSWPERHTGSADYFYLQRSAHPWVAAVVSPGLGLGQASTPELAGRKMFTWGGGTGGRTWQSWLSGSSAYAEIQAGLGHTQLEHLRLPAGQTIRFTESYTPIHVDSDADWGRAVRQAEAATVDAAALEAAHRRLSHDASLPVNGVGASLVDGDWGALEVAAGFLPDDPARPFAQDRLTQEQEAWLQVARAGTIDLTLQTSALVSPEWSAALEQAEDGWLKELLLGHARHAAGDTPSARAAWQSSLEQQPSADAHRALALTTDDTAERCTHLMAGHGLEPERRGLLIETLTALIVQQRHDDVVRIASELPAALRNLPRVVYLECQALVGLGEADAVGEILARPLVLPDLREGDVGLDRLWFAYQDLIGGDDPLPAHYDFRMAGTEELPTA